jgi:hypothetical protein
MTIRRDLEVLARDGLVEKVHGGAVLPGTPSSHDPGFEAKLVLERPEKTAIARAAAALVRRAPRSRWPPGRPPSRWPVPARVPGLTIVTNSLRAQRVQRRGGWKRPGRFAVVLTGGVRTPRTRWSARSPT